MKIDIKWKPPRRRTIFEIPEIKRKVCEAIKKSFSGDYSINWETGIRNMWLDILAYHTRRSLLKETTMKDEIVQFVSPK